MLNAGEHEGSNVWTAAVSTHMNKPTQAEVNMLQPADISAAIHSHPPLKRQGICKTYVGKEVDWLATFINGWKEPKGRAGLAFQVEPHGMTIFGMVPLASYPWLESLGANTAVRVRGKIRKLNALSITLDILELALPEPAIH